MFDLFKSFDMSQMMFYGKIALIILGILVFAATIIILKTAANPSIQVLQWLFAYSPGERPNDMVAGVSYGLRLTVWSALVGLTVWFIFH